MLLYPGKSNMTRLMFIVIFIRVKHDNGNITGYFGIFKEVYEELNDFISFNRSADDTGITREAFSFYFLGRIRNQI